MSTLLWAVTHRRSHTCGGSEVLFVKAAVLTVLRRVENRVNDLRVKGARFGYPELKAVELVAARRLMKRR